MDLINKIRSCATMRELDELRIDIIHEAESGGDFNKLQKAFITKQNSLRRNGHSRWREGYELHDVIKKQKVDGKIK